MTSARDVATELRRRIPGLPTKKLHKLLYYCQGQHLAHFGEPLFTEPVMAWDMGPVVANLWWQDKHGEQLAPARPLDNGQANTVAYVVSRYGRLTGNDLERLTHSEQPWQIADKDRQPGGSARMDLVVMRAFFAGDAVDDDAVWPTPATVSAWLAGAERDGDAPGRPDSRDEIESRLAALG